MALYPTKHTLPQGSLHYRLLALGYQKQNPLWGSSILQTSFVSFSLLKEMKLKKRNTDGVEKGISNDDLSFSL